MITLKIEKPNISNDTVWFQWSSDKNVPVFKRNSFYIKYDGLNIEDIPLDVFWSVFLSLMVPLVNTLDEDSLFLFPEKLPRYVAETWINFHGANKITIRPISKEKTINLSKLKSKKDSKSNKKYEAAVLYGGGKDSTYAYSVLSEILGTKNVLIISYVYSWSQEAISKVDKRRDNFMLNPLKKDFNSQIQKIISNFTAILTNFTSVQVPHVAIYTGPALPVLIKYNVKLLTHTNELISYRINKNEFNEESFNYERSRPEYDNYLSERTNNYFKTNFAISNLSYFLSGPAAFKIIAERYPNMLNHISMCEFIGNPNRRWCQSCRKCAEYVLYSLHNKYDQKNINLNYFFTKGSYVRNLLKNSENLSHLTSEHGNYPWIPYLDTDTHYEPMCNAIASIDPIYVRERTSDRGFNNFMLLKSRYGNKEFPYQESLIDSAFKQLKLPYSDKIRTIVSNHCKIVKEPIIYLYKGNNLVKIDYTAKCPIPEIFSENHEDS